jgi:N-acetylmuramoyl-L-alanine amidase
MNTTVTTPPVEVKKDQVNPPSEQKKLDENVASTIAQETSNAVIETTLVFRIQFYAAVSRAAKGSKYDKDFASSIIYEDNGKGILRYMVGSFASIEGASQKLKEVKSKGYTDAFIVVYKNGKRDNITNYLK